jgi:hypothetical protein
MGTLSRFAAALAMAVVLPAAALAAEPPATTRVQVTINHLKAGKTDAWVKAYKDTVLPALKKAGIPWYTVSEQVFGDKPVYTHIRPLDKFAELDGPGVLDRVGLPQKQREAAQAILNDSRVSQKVFIVNEQNEFAVPASGPAPIHTLLMLRSRAGQGAALLALLRADVLPAMRQAKQAGKIASWGVSTTGQGYPGLTVISTGYPNLAALDAGNAMAQAMGAPAYALYQMRLAQLADVEDAIVSRQVADLSYSPGN